MPRIAKCDKCGKWAEMPYVYQGSAMPEGFVYFRSDHEGKVLCLSCHEQYESFFNKLKEK